MKQVQLIWTPEEKQRVAGMLREGLSAGKIAPHFDRTRNAVIGLVHRDAVLREIGFARKGNTGKAASRGLRRANDAKPGRVIKHAIITAPSEIKPIPVAPIRAAERHLAGVPMRALGAHQCKFAVNNAAVGETHLFCGSKTDGGAWCQFHRGLVYRPYEQPARAQKQLEPA